MILGTGSDYLWDEASWLQVSALGSREWVDCWRWWPPGSHTGVCAPVVVCSHTQAARSGWSQWFMGHVYICACPPGILSQNGKSLMTRGEMRWNKIPAHTSVVPALPPEHHKREWRGHVGYRSLSRVHVEQNCSAEFRTRSNGVLKQPTSGIVVHWGSVCWMSWNWETKLVLGQGLPINVFYLFPQQIRIQWWVWHRSMSSWSSLTDELNKQGTQGLLWWYSG